MTAATTMRIGLNLPARSLATLPDLAGAAEAAGFGALRIGDMQSTTRELYTALTVIATATSRVDIGPGVTNPVTRHPAVVASALASLQELSGGRAVLGIGTGDSALELAGVRRTGLADLEAYIRGIRSLHENGQAQYRDGPMSLSWWSGGRIPILVSAHGPRTLELAGRIADGVVVGLGTGAAAREYAAEHIEAGARAAGRDPSAITVWYLAYLHLGSDARRSAIASGSGLAVGANLLIRSPARALVPDRYRAALREFATDYSYRHHAGGTVDNVNGDLLERLQLTDYLAEQFGVFGTAEEVNGRLNELCGLGIRHIWGAYVQPDIDEFVQRWGDELQGAAVER